jgi:hypothetical protein
LLAKTRSRSEDLYEDVTGGHRLGFRTAMIGHFRSHIPVTNINE